VTRNLPAHVASRRPAVIVRQRPVRRLTAVERLVPPPEYVRVRMHFGPDLRVMLKVIAISLVIAFLAGLFVWLVTQ
jgi:hypothetical protein